ncbi:unnamed protein product [Ceratitis capitata]|uniref:(Mediterranean fruit fly) hypothetical protein n=1 Tax=Ceratitis capitata TaxID=7213 RepID=A0A811VF15_CERCA|nr:unnamed protein product [Ceratitis capitata]
MLPDMVVEWQQSAPQPMLSVGAKLRSNSGARVFWSFAGGQQSPVFVGCATTLMKSKFAD